MRRISGSLLLSLAKNANGDQNPRAILPHPFLATPIPCFATPHTCQATPYRLLANTHPFLATLHPCLTTPHPCSHVATPHRLLATTHTCLVTHRKCLSMHHRLLVTHHTCLATPHRLLATPLACLATPRRFLATSHCLLPNIHPCLATLHRLLATPHPRNKYFVFLWFLSNMLQTHKRVLYRVKICHKDFLTKNQKTGFTAPGHIVLHMGYPYTTALTLKKSFIPFCLQDMLMYRDLTTVTATPMERSQCCQLAENSAPYFNFQYV